MNTSPNTVEGFDISDEGIFNFGPAVASGRRFCFIKATEGIDPGYRQSQTFGQNWANAKDAGLLRGAYHYLRGQHDGKTQAELLYSHVQATGDLGELPPAVDCEETPERNAPGATIYGPCVRDFIDRVSQLWGRRPLVYCGPGFWTPTHVSDEDAAYIAAHADLWLAAWNPTPPTVRGWEQAGPTFWQYAGNQPPGAIPGIGAQVDFNRFMLGDEGTLHAWAQSALAVPPRASNGGKPAGGGGGGGGGLKPGSGGALALGFLVVLAALFGGRHT